MQYLTILLVEDEPLIACDLRTELERMGHFVIATMNPGFALQLCARHLPNAAILNFRFPHALDGMTLAKRLRTHYLVKVLLVTGARWQDMEGSPDFYAGTEVLYKPFTRRQLCDSLADFLP